MVSLFCLKQIFKSEHPDSNTKASDKGRQNIASQLFKLIKQFAI